jgi:hypothetical protein
MVMGLAGCPGKDHTADPVGTWVVSYDYGCDGNPGSAVWHIHDNGTFIDSFGNTSTFNVKGDSITINLSYGTILSGTVENNNAMSGAYYTTSGGSGCWSATKTSDTP